MANSVSSHNDRTMFKVISALTQDGAMTLDQAMAAIDRMMNAGILFREPAERVTRNGKDEEAAPIEG